MEVKLAVLADSANVSIEGKLNILGIFNMIGAANFPATHPQMQLVLSLSADTAEQGQTKDMEIQLCNPDGGKVCSLSGKLAIPKGDPGYPVGMNHILILNGLRFDKPGDYVFNILVNGDPKEHVHLMVRQVNPPANNKK